MIRLVKTPRIFRIWYPSLTWKKNTNKTIYFTFDDGPHPEITQWVMRQLDKVNAKATFFCIGRKLEENSDIAKELLQNGHRIGNHTFSHLNGWNTQTDSYLHDVENADVLINELKSEEMKLFRPPYGRIKKKQIQQLKTDFEIVMWSHLSWDFSEKVNCNKVISKLKRAKAGSIIVFHDSEMAFSNLQKILPSLLAHFNSKGFKLETL